MGFQWNDDSGFKHAAIEEMGALVQDIRNNPSIDIEEKEAMLQWATYYLDELSNALDRDEASEKLHAFSAQVIQLLDHW